MTRESYLKGLRTRAAKWPSEKAFREIWLRLVAAHIAEPARASDLRHEAQIIAMEKAEGVSQ